MNAPLLERNLEICQKFAEQEIKDKAALAKHYRVSRPRIFKICQEAKKWERLAKKAEKAKRNV